MKKLILMVVAFATLAASQLFLAACNDGETYAEMKDKEKNSINKFLKDNELVGPIKVISESTFLEQDSLTNVDENEFVLFNEDGIYMQIVRKGEGKNMVEMAKEQADSTISKVLLCRFFEYDIQNADTTISNYYVSAIVDKMLCTYKHQGRSYSASFTEGRMRQAYSGYVPAGWLKPLDYIRLTRNAGKQAKVRLIVPHSSGTSNASNYVLPYYYEISYELGK
ncbi:MAG: DUF4827 domain-containing protein [Bacteroidaceae bacterium]|jgi:hypothetical protein|nr:DUF4827 domain-containing protein [Bacteroidaceae bacterium]